jgi:HTH-type transcriptional regulator / antitoxin MqsA
MMGDCHVCGSSDAHTEHVSEIFGIDGKHTLVENIPAMVCDKCGEPTLSRETTEQVRRMVHGDAEPIGTIEVDVFSFQP